MEEGSGAFGEDEAGGEDDGAADAFVGEERGWPDEGEVEVDEEGGGLVEVHDGDVLGVGVPAS